MKKLGIETGVGIFLILGILSMAFLSVKLGHVNLFGTKQYSVKARFANISGLKEGAIVEVAGVVVGKVARIRLENYEAFVELLIDPSVKLQKDSIASIRTSGIIGDKYVKITPGGSEEYIKTGEKIRDTESGIDIEELVSKYIFNK